MFTKEVSSSLARGSSPEEAGHSRAAYVHSLGQPRPRLLPRGGWAQSRGVRAQSRPASPEAPPQRRLDTVAWRTCTVSASLARGSSPEEAGHSHVTYVHRQIYIEYFNTEKHSKFSLSTSKTLASSKSSSGNMFQVLNVILPLGHRSV